MQQKFDVEVVLSDLHTTAVYEEVEANNKAEAMLSGERMAIRQYPAHTFGKIKATLSAKRIDAERRAAASRALTGYETYEKAAGA